MKHLTLTIALLMMLSTQAMADQYEKNETKWGNFISKNKWGGSQDYYLQIFTSLNEWETVAVVMGYLDDWTSCKEIISGLQETGFMDKEYRCIPANK